MTDDMTGAAGAGTSSHGQWLDTLARAETENAWLVIAPSCADELNDAWAAYNTGVFGLRNVPDAHALLSSMSHAPMDEIEKWWDADRLGMFTHGDQDALVWFMESGGHESRIHWVDPLGWNARPWHYSGSLQDAPVCHFPGHPDKTLAISEFALRMGTDQSLVRPGTPEGRRHAVHAQVPAVGRAGVRVRRISVGSRRLARRVVRKLLWIREHRSWS